MPANRKLWVRVSVVAALVLAFSGLATTLAAAAAAADTVKYYQVSAAYNGQPENLAEIAQRFLGDAHRANEILGLNAGRRQPDGGALVDGGPVRAGWYLVLPWDAVGVAVTVGPLPTAAPTPKPTTRPTPKPTPSTVHPGAGGPGGCATAHPTSPGTNWAALRMAPTQAWTRTHGEGVTVAVVDSGVDATLPELTGRVAVGADIVSGTGRGNTDCLGTGTAMAGIIAAQPGQTSSMNGLAPAAGVLPVRLVTTSPTAPVADQATAIEVAVSAGATVVALGSYVDITDPRVAATIAQAATHNVVIVAGAPTGSGASSSVPPEVLRVAGVGVDNKLAGVYRSGDIDVTAPGVNIGVLGISGTGEQVGSGTYLAVAFAAGEAALVRSAHPDLTAAQVVHRIEATADKFGAAVPNATTGWGIIDPAAAVNQTLPEESPSSAPVVAAPVVAGADPPSAGSTVALVLVVLVGLVAVAAFGFRVRRMVMTRAGRDRGDEPGPTITGGDDPGQRAQAWRAAMVRELAEDPDSRAGAASAADTDEALPTATSGAAPGRRTREVVREQR